MACNLRKVTIFQLLILLQREGGGAGTEKHNPLGIVGREVIQGKVSFALRKHSLRWNLWHAQFVDFRNFN